MEKEVLECILKNHWKNSLVKRVLSVESSSAVGKNENFLSTVSRLKVKVILGNGRVTTRSFIHKDSRLAYSENETFSKDHQVFKIEIMMYETIIKEMEFLMEEFEDTRGFLWCQLIHQVPYSSLLLEDLTASGFRKLKKETFMDLDHTLMMVDGLARFHAMAKVLEEQGFVSKEDYKPWYITEDSDQLIWSVWNMNSVVQGIKKYWKPVWASVVDKIKMTEDMFREKLKDMRETTDEEFKVLNHGDLNINNIMCKYDWNNRPIEIRFIDFQIPHYGSPACDLTYMLSVVTDPLVRRSQMDLIVKTYHESLIKNLDFFNFSGSKPSLDEIKDGMKKHSFLHLLMTICFCPFHLHPDKESKLGDMDKIKATEGMEGYNLEIYKNPSLEDYIGPDLERFANDFF